MSQLHPLKKWFLDQRRDLPWRDSPTPYAVWVSEVMLQQTQVAVVIPYFMRWMERFPTVQALASASIEEVIKLWEGLGYYSRARNLHQGARYVMEHHEGALPDTFEELNKIKGLGPYTIGAVLSFAFHKKATAVDGNVVRVLTRFLGIRDDISKPKTIELIRQQALALLPDDESWIINEALIELGATICQKKAKCGQCPLKERCVAHNQDLVEQLPHKSAKTQYEKLERTVAVVTCKDHYLVRKGQDGEIMNDLHQFVYFEAVMQSKDLKKKLQNEWTLELEKIEPLEQVNHSFTKYRVKLHPFLCSLKSFQSVEGYEWRSREELQHLAFSSGHRRIWFQLCSANLTYL